jgi:hypothetical protein
MFEIEKNSRSQLDHLRQLITKKFQHHDSLLRSMADRFSKMAETTASDKQPALSRKDVECLLDEIVSPIVEEMNNMHEIVRLIDEKLDNEKTSIRSDFEKHISEIHDRVGLLERVVEGLHNQLEFSTDSQNGVNNAVTTTLQTMADEIISQRELLLKTLSGVSAEIVPRNQFSTTDEVAIKAVVEDHGTNNEIMDGIIPTPLLLPPSPPPQTFSAESSAVQSPGTALKNILIKQRRGNSVLSKLRFNKINNFRAASAQQRKQPQNRTMFGVIRLNAAKSPVFYRRALFV